METAASQLVLCLLYGFGAVAAGCLVGKLLSSVVSGVCLSLCYVVVLAMIGTGNAGSQIFAGYHGDMATTAEGNAWLQHGLETALVLLVSVIIYEFVNQQLREQRRHTLRRQAFHSNKQQQQQQELEEELLHWPEAAQQQEQQEQELSIQQFTSTQFGSEDAEPADDLDDALPYAAADQQQHHQQQQWPKDMLQQQSKQHALSHIREAVSNYCDFDADQEFWRGLPDAVFSDVLERLPPADRGNMRVICTHWFEAAKRTTTQLRPNQFPVRDLVVDFPNIKALDLSNCTKDISPTRLRCLHRLSSLEDITLGCHHRLIASSVTDACIAELVLLTNLRSLNLSQCVHVGDGGMMSLVYLSSLRSLNISGCVAVTDIGIMMVAQLTNLTSLDMPWCVKVTNIGLKALAPLNKLTNLNISGCQLITEQGISCLGSFTNLEKLSLLNLGYSKVCVTDAALERLSGLTKLRSLNIGSMQLCNKMVTDSSMRMIASHHKQLTQLGLMSLDISDAGVALLAQLSSLRALNLRGCTRVSSGCLRYLSTLTCITDLCLLHNSKLEVDDACLSSLAKLPNLQILGLGNFQVNANASDTCLVPLSATRQLLVLSIAFFTGRYGPQTCDMFTRMSSLQHLDLQGSQHADAALLAAVGKLTALQSLHLSRCCQIDDVALQNITGLSNLHTLNISICYKVTDVGLAAITKLQNLTHLLAQQCKDVTDAGVALLGKLTKLQVLDLSLCERITGSGFHAFTGCTQMATLSLNGCSSLNDGGLRAIGRIFSLTKLDLSNCQLVTDVGVSYLRGLGELTGLDLALCIRIGDGALAAIASSMHQLATIKLNGCIRITDLGVNEVCNIASLLTLHLDRCVHITDLGLQCLTRLTGLTSLRISRCPNITDMGVAALSKLSRLSTLSLAQCPRVTDVGLMALAPLTTLASLEF